MIKKIILSFLFIHTQIYGCVYVDCYPLVQAKIASFEIKSAEKFAQLDVEKLKMIKSYISYMNQIDRYISLQNKEIALKKELILKLKQKERSLDSRIKINFMKE